MTRIVTEPIPRAALLAAWLCALSGCSAYDGGLLESAQADGAVQALGIGDRTPEGGAIRREVDVSFDDDLGHWPRI